MLIKCHSPKRQDSEFKSVICSIYYENYIFPYLLFKFKAHLIGSQQCYLALQTLEYAQTQAARLSFHYWGKAEPFNLTAVPTAAQLLTI